jgi:hypothetical protein
MGSSGGEDARRRATKRTARNASEAFAEANESDRERE